MTEKRTEKDHLRRLARKGRERSRREERDWKLNNLKERFCSMFETLILLD